MEGWNKVVSGKDLDLGHTELLRAQEANAVSLASPLVPPLERVGWMKHGLALWERSLRRAWRSKWSDGWSFPELTVGDPTFACPEEMLTKTVKQKRSSNFGTHPGPKAVKETFFIFRSLGGGNSILGFIPHSYPPFFFADKALNLFTFWDTVYQSPQLASWLF